MRSVAPVYNDKKPATKQTTHSRRLTTRQDASHDSSPTHVSEPIVNHPRTLTNENKSVGRSVGRSRSIDRAIDRAIDRDDDDARRHNAAPHVTGTSDEMISTTMTTNVAARGVALSRAAPKARRTAGVARAGDGIYLGAPRARARRIERRARCHSPKCARAGEDTIRARWWIWWRGMNGWMDE